MLNLFFTGCQDLIVLTALTTKAVWGKKAKVTLNSDKRESL